MNSLIKIEGLSFTYPGAQKAALSRVDLAIGQGEFVGITGPAGSGTSTLLICINGIIPHFQEGEEVGSVRFKALILSRHPAVIWPGASAGF